MGLPRPDPRSLCPLSSTDFVDPFPEKIPGVKHPEKTPGYATACSCVLTMHKTLEVAADCKIRSVICILNARSVLPTEIHYQICQVCGDNVMGDGMVRKWVVPRYCKCLNNRGEYAEKCFEECSIS
jgi:hypothetical protein